MSFEDLVDTIADTLSKLDNLLISPEVNADPAQKQLLVAMRNHLDDQQRELVKEIINADDVDFQTFTGLIETATDRLEEQLENMDKIDAIVNTVSTISASVDRILKIVP